MKPATTKPPVQSSRVLSVCVVLATAAVTALASQMWPEAHPPVGQQPKRPSGYRPFRYPKDADALWTQEGSNLRAHAAAVMKDVTTVIARGQYRADPESIAKHPCPEWFLDAKFGMFIDWGPWSVGGWAPQAEKATYPDWYEQKLFNEFRDYHVKTWGADIGPDDLIQLLRGDAFQPGALVQLAQRAGMRYVVPFLKHHGGYALWDSSFTHRDSAEWGLRRDIGREFRDASRASRLRFGAYVSLGEWSYPIARNGAIHALRFDGTTTEPLTTNTPFVSGKVPVTDYAQDYLVPSIAELIERTDPDLLWFDGEWESPAATWRSPDIAAFYYNRAAALGREVAINDRFGKDTRSKAGWGDFFTSEFHVIEGFQPHAWEENRSLSHSYGYNWEESFDERFVLSEQAALDLLLRVVANGGNLLLMVSPDGSGRVPPNQVRRLEFIGNWLAAYGDAIYGTRALGLARQPSWGYMTRSKAGDRVYCIVTHWPADGRLDVPARGVRRARLMHGGVIPVTGTGPETTLDLSSVRPPDPHASVVVLEVER